MDHHRRRCCVAATLSSQFSRNQLHENTGNLLPYLSYLVGVLHTGTAGTDMRTTRFRTSAAFGLAAVTSAAACVDDGAARDDVRIEPYTDHDEPLDFEPVEG